MKFVARINLPNRTPPVRAYLHTAGLESAYGTDDPNLSAKDYLMEVLEAYGDGLDHLDIILATIWGSGTDKTIDFCGIGDIRNSWHNNGDVMLWNVKNGIYLPPELKSCIPPYSCGG